MVPVAAGAYKSLTIRIGGDTTKLSSALRGVNSAIYKTQSELNKLSKAARLDPGNASIAKAQFGAFAEQATNSAKKIETLKAGIEELGEIKVLDSDGKETDQTIAELAEGTDAVRLKAEEANLEYERINGSLENTYKEIKQITGVDLAEATRAGNFEMGMRAAATEAVRLGVNIDDQLTAVLGLKDEWMAASSAKKNYEDASKFTSLNNDLELEKAKIKDIANAFANLKIPTSTVTRSIEPLNRTIEAIGKGVDAAKSRFERLNAAAQIKPHSIGIAVDRLKAFNEAVTSSREKAEQLRKKMEAFKAAGVDKMAKGVKDAATNYELAKNKVSELRRQLIETVAAEGRNSAKAKELQKALEDALRSADTAAAVNEFKELEVQMRENETLAKSLKDSMKASLGGMGAATVQAASQMGQLAQQAGQKVITSSNDIDASYRNLRKTFDATESDYQKLYDAAMAYSQTHVTSADKMLEMESIAAQLGVGLDGGADAIQHFAEVASNLDVATDIDADTIALQMGQIVNVMHDLDNSKPETITGFADALVRLGNNMPTQESNIMQITQRLSAIGDVAGFTTPQLMGWAAAIASTGQKSEAAASGIATTITKISTAISTGGEDLKKWADVAGMSAKQFKREWQNDPSEALKKVIKGLKDSGDDLFATLTDVDVNGVRQTQTLASLAQTIETVDTAVGMADNAFNGLSDDFGKTGDAAIEAEKKASGFSGTLAKLENSGQVLAATLGNAMVGPMEWFAEKLQWVTDIVNSWSDNTKEKVVLAGGAFAVFSTTWPIISTLGGALKDFASGALTMLVGGIAKVIVYGKGFASLLGSWIKAPAEVAGALSGMGGAIGGLGTALGFLATPLGVVVGSLALVAAALGGEYVVKTMKAKKSAEEFQGAMEGIQSVTEGLGQSIYGASDYISDYAEKWSAARIDMEKYHKSLKEHTDKQAEAMSTMKETVGTLTSYHDIIGKAIGKGEDFKGNVGELQWAIDKLNESTGSSWTLQDILTGKYKDEEGAIRSTKKAIDDLIESKKREAQISGIETAMSENTAAKEQNKLARKNAASAYRDYLDMKWDVQGQLGQQDQWSSKQDFAKSLMTTDEHFQDLAFDVKKLRKESIALDDQYDDLSNTLGGLIDLSTIQETSNYGVRESMMRTNSAMEDALRTYMGFTDNTIEEGTKRLAEGIRNAGVGMTEFASMSSDTFTRLAQESGGDIDLLVQKIAEWNEQQLEEKYGRISWGDESKTWFTDAEGKRYEWNGNEWEQKEVDVKVNDGELDEAKSKEQEVQNKANEGAEMDVKTDDSELDETVQKIESQTNETKTVTYDTNDGAIDEAKGKVDSLENKTVQVSVNAEDSGVTRLKEDLNSIDNKEVKVSINADTAGASAITDALSGLSGKPVDVKINADTSGADQITNALSGLSDKPVNVKINADTSGAQALNEAINGIPDSKTSRVNIAADMSAAQELNGMLNSIPPTTTATITAVTSNVAAATTRIQNLNAASGAMQNQKKTYTASGNAATSTTPANNIRSLNSAAGNMGSRSATYSAYGNAANGNAAGHVWDLVRAINNLNSKSITVTTNYVNNGSPGKKATGAYIPYNKIPKHAAGIFTKPTLTNIGWVGESGAELYSGNSLVPLTNRKYSMPYINDISDAVAKKIGSGGDTYNLSIDGVKINDDPAIQAVILELFDVLQRKGAMNVG